MRVLQSERGAVIGVSGNLDWCTESTLREAVATVGDTPRTIIDLTGVKSFDSAGMGALIVTFLEMHEAGTTMALVANEADLMAVLVHVGIVDVVPVFTSRKDAEEWLEGRG
jgi:anti-anti-sigma factor